MPSWAAGCLAVLMVSAAMSFRAAGQAPSSAWVYPSATGNLLYQLDERGQRIADFSQCGYRGGTEPLPNVTALISQNRWVTVSPGTGDDTALIQAAIDTAEAMTLDANGWRGVVLLTAGEYQLANSLTINASGVVLKGVGDSATTGTRLRATDARQYSLISVNGSGSRSTVSGTTHSLVQKLVPAGTRTFEVEGTSGLAVGHTVIVKRPSTANWIVDMDMDQLGPDPVVPWTAGSKDLTFDRVITRIDGNWITVDVPLPQTFETQYGGGQIWRYTWSGRIQQVGIEDLYGLSDYASATDEDHGWKFIQMSNTQHGWVRNITAQYFGYAAVSVGDGAKWLTVADCQSLDPISVIDGGRRYSFNNDGAECALFVNNYARKGRHDFVFGALVPGPNAFVHGTADTVYADSGPHHRWSVGGLFDLITINGNELNVRNRGNSGTGHGWAGAYMTVWNCKANGFRVRNPPTARNWLIGSIGTISASGFPVGADPEGTYDRSGPSGTGKAVHTRSLYYGQLQQRMKWPGSEFREVWLGDVDQHSSTGGTGESVRCDATWLAQVEALGALPAEAKFDLLTGNRSTAFTFDLPLAPGETIVAASLTVSLRAITSADADNLWLESTTSPQSLTSLGWTPISTTAPTVRTVEISPAALTDGRLNVAVGDHVAVDYAVVHFQVQKAQPVTQIITLTPVADAYVQGGTNAATNYGTTASLITKDDSNIDLDREFFLRWDLTGVSGKLVQAKVRLAGTSAAQLGNENCATFVSNDSWGETTLTYSNKPTSDNLFAQWLPVTGQAVEFIVTPQVAETLLGDGLLSLRILSTDNHGANGTVSYASRENATVANRPQLILTIENPVPATPVTITVPIAAGADDAEESVTGVVSLVSTDLELVNDAPTNAGDQLVGLRFAGLALPPRAVITSATLQFKADEAQTESTTLDITVQAADTVPTFTTAASNLSSRPVSTTSVLWQPPAWNTIGEIAPAQRTPNLAGIVQDIVSRPGWASGNAMAFLIRGTGHRTAEAFDKPSSVPASLSITYLAESPASFAQWMTGYPTLTGSNRLTSADPDGDAFNNLLEYALGTHPAQSTAAPYSLTKQGSTLAFTYSRPSLAPELTYTIEWSQTLTPGSWSTTGVTQQITSDTGTTRTIRATVPAGADRQLVRLKVVGP
jgi:hypothetical protein